MHLAEGTLPLEHAAAWTAAACPVLLWSLRAEQRARQESQSASVVMAGATSLLFAATLLPLPVPVAGATSHICLTPVLALLVGLRRIVWPAFFVLLLQAVFFAHGGLTTLGVNALTLGLFGPLVSVGLWALFRKLGVGNAIGLAMACGAGGVSVYVIDALVLAAALSEVSEPMTTFIGVVLGFAPVQLPLAVLEALVSLAIIRVVATRRPDLVGPTLKHLARVPPKACSVLGVFMLFGLTGCDYEGIDGSVFGSAAEAAGRAPLDSILDLSQGEVGLAMNVIILFGLGFLAGRSWERLLKGASAAKGEHDALPR